MKKTLVSALTTALVVGAASTTFAAANPFSDVPADHWAYDAVTQLAADGVIEGYGDSTFKGNRNITRYEMAQMVAKAMAKNTSGVDKALVDKLAAEFAEELNNLGVRVSNLERNADMVKWNGEARFTYTSDRNKDTAAGTSRKDNNTVALLRLEPTAEVNDHWHVKARLDANHNLNTDNGNNNVTLKRVWAQGDYNKFQVKLGKFASINNDSFADTDFSGAEVSYGKEIKGILGAGRLSTSVYDGRRYGKAANYLYLGVEAKKDKLSGGLYWHRLNTESLGAMVSRRAFLPFYKDAREDTANILAVKAGYKITKSVGINGFYSQNTGADRYKKAASAELTYKGAQKENKGTWGAWVAYRHLGSAALVKPTYDVIKPDFKGWEIGANYTPFKNVVGTVRYGDAKEICDKNLKEKILFGRVQFFF